VSLREEAEAAGCHAASLLARIHIASTQISEGREVPAARQALLACIPELSSDTAARHRLLALSLLGDAELALGNPAEAKSLYREAHKTARALKDQLAEAHQLRNLSAVEWSLGDRTRAHRQIDQSIDLFRTENRKATSKQKLSTGINLGVAICTKAELARLDGNLSDAIARATEAEPLFRGRTGQDNLGRTHLFRAHLLFGDGKLREGLKYLTKAIRIFESIGNIGWQCHCYNELTKFFERLGDGEDALKYCGTVLHLVARNGSPAAAIPVEAVPYLLKFASLCLKQGKDNTGNVFLQIAKGIASRAKDNYQLAQCTNAQADTLGGDNLAPKRAKYLRAALQHLESALPGCTLKGQGAQCAAEIAALHNRLRNLPEARLWFERALREFEATGDVEGAAECLGDLSTLAREEGSTGEAITLLERLLDVSKGKSLPRLRAEALLDLGLLRLSQKDIAQAKRCFGEAQAIVSKHSLQDTLKRLYPCLFQLADMERFYQPATKDLGTLIQELHEWCTLDTAVGEAILPLWYYVHASELWGICRSMLGVKFLICAQDPSGFHGVADAFRAWADLLVWGCPLRETVRPQAELIPWLESVAIPPHLPVAEITKARRSPGELRRTLFKALGFMPRQQNVWVNSSGSGRRPNV
jgi:tetratricopeptide (TPR) repeat protein